MANMIQLDVVTPDRLVVTKQVEMVVAPGAEGEFGVLAGHIPFLSTLRSGELRYTVEGQVNYLAVTGGFAEVGPEKVTVLADSAEESREIDIDRAKKARERAEERLKMAKSEDTDFARAQAALQRAMARLRVAEKTGN
jgi:F-type H+-transporting ATPase subunit epsilon